VIPRTVLELLTSWGASVGYGCDKEAWRERNARLFEDVETSMVELRKRLLNMLYIWIAPHHCLNAFTFIDFLNLFSSHLIQGLSCILPVYKGCAPLRF
jgi:hypothetical protein